jgi:hypothetical protein
MKRKLSCGASDIGLSDGTVERDESDRKGGELMHISPQTGEEDFP